MNRFWYFGLIAWCLLIAACDSKDNGPVSSGQAGFDQAVSSPVNVFGDYIAVGAALESNLSSSSTYTDLLYTYENLLTNGGFEDDLNEWTACGAEKLSISSDAYLDESAARLEPGTCIYQSAQVEPGRIYTLSCFARITAGSEWTGLGMDFSNKGWKKIEGSAPSLITRNTYQRYDIVATAPQTANHVSVWLYTDNDVVVDSCLLLEDSNPPEPPAQGSTELLNNGGFDLVTENGPVDWSFPCSSDWRTGFFGGFASRELELSAGACVSQGLSASDIAILKGSAYRLTCDVLKPTNRGTLGFTYGDGTASAVVIADSNEYQTVSLGGVAQYDINSPSVVLKLDEGGTAAEPMRVKNCSLVVTPTEPTPNQVVSNHLKNAAFEDLAANGSPEHWEKGCGGKWSLTQSADNATSVSLTDGACLQQVVSSDFALRSSGKEIAFSCNARNASGYADITLFVDGVEHKSVVPPTGNEETVVVTVPAQAFTNVHAVVYGEGEVTFNECSLLEPGSSIGVNLVRNPKFEQGLENWQNRCDGFANHGRTFDGLLSTGGGSCVHQILNADAVEVMRGNDFEYSCTYTSSHDEYAEIATNLAAPGEPFVSTEMPRTYFSGEPAWKFETVTIRGTASENINEQNAILAINSEGENGVVVIGCSLKVIGLN